MSDTQRGIRAWILRRLNAVEREAFDAVRDVSDRRFVRIARLHTALTIVRDSLDGWTVGGVATMSPDEIHEVVSAGLRDDTDPLEEALRL